MQINRLLEIVYILLEKKLVTAKELAGHFEVSQRTIYRDVDVLSAAGIPVYANRGKGGGICLLENFVLNKTVLSDKEQIDILSSLQSLKALNVSNIEPVLRKLSAMFDKEQLNWIEVDFSPWSSSTTEQEKFNIIKTAIFNNIIVTFDYYSSYGKKTTRTVEPVKLLFKSQAWYLYGFCRDKEDFRIFKVTRIKNLTSSEETFTRKIPENIWYKSHEYNNKLIKLVMQIDSFMAYRVYDEFDHDHIVRNSDGSLTVNVCFPEDQWVYNYILSYGNYAEVLQPDHVREIIKTKIKDSLKKYS
ncbi:helix-turn-helix transcriptional regulator [Candidatus Contubernalis alkaliaceticus]|uniref:helix-turn-helix transcriptional regulator n=1 Tax=Candidatus Contubernalis alkaliaceticus TaxID=338645 RepID=UPI001F4C02D9|nr:YafY family protein [Candidatus Contubernalis alkalaceticus]UNC92273.1 YafY family transcriptional regulator [Candidatus Contubernalis alkalaceticus]